MSKTVSGSDSSYSDQFTFMVTLDRVSVNGVYGEMTFDGGVAVFTLKHGESKTASGLPAGIGYQVEETDNGGYRMSASGESGTIPDGGTAKAEFHNTKSKPTPPGASSPDDPGTPGKPEEPGDPGTPRTADSANPFLRRMPMAVSGIGILLLLILAIWEKRKE